MTAAGLVPVIPQRDASSVQYDPPPPGSARPSQNDELASHARPPREVAQWPAFDGSHGYVPEGPRMGGPEMDPFPMYVPSLASIQPVTDFWDAPCDCEPES